MSTLLINQEQTQIWLKYYCQIFEIQYTFMHYTSFSTNVSHDKVCREVYQITKLY